MRFWENLATLRNFGFGCGISKVSFRICGIFENKNDNHDWYRYCVFKQANDWKQMLRNAINILKLNKATINKCTDMKIIWMCKYIDIWLLLNWKRNIKCCNTTRDIQILIRIYQVIACAFQMSKQNKYVRKIASLSNGFSFLFLFHHGELIVYWLLY